MKKKGFPIDGAALQDELGDTGFLFIGGNERILALKGCVPSVHAFKSYEKMVINRWKITTSKDLLQSALDSELNTEGIQTLIKDLSQVDEQGTQEEFDLKEHLMNMYDLVTVPTPKQRSGVVSGFMDIDSKTDGFTGMT